MDQKPNYVGERYGRLIVIAPTESKHNRSRWICQCDCGKQCVATGASLRSGKKKSCGCLRREVSVERAKLLAIRNTLPTGEADSNQLYATYKWQASNRGLEFSLTKEEFKKLNFANCFYCGKPPSQKLRSHVYNGVDRQDNAKGYTVENCVSCCGPCNDMKRTRTVKEFLDACRAVVAHQKVVAAQSAEKE